MSVLGDMAGAAGAAAISNIFGIMAGDHARKENYRYGEMQAENADRRTRALYRDLYSIPAQMNQLKQAGLSPSLYYGEAGGLSGQSGAMGASAALQNQVYGIDPLTMSQIQVNNAQAKKLKAEAETETGENERGKASIANMWADANATKASAELTKAQKTATDLANYVADATKEFDIFKAASLADKESNLAWRAYEEAKNAKLEWQFNKETYQTRVEKVAADKAYIIAETMFLEAKKELTDQEKEESIQRINKMLSETWQQWAQVDISQQNADSYQKWVDGKLPYIEKELELEAKRLGIEKTRMILNFTGDLVKSGGAVIGGAMLRGKGAGGIGNPVNNPKHVLDKNWKYNKTERKGRLIDYSETYDF